MKIIANMLNDRIPTVVAYSADEIAILTATLKALAGNGHMDVEGYRYDGTLSAVGTVIGNGNSVSCNWSPADGGLLDATIPLTLSLTIVHGVMQIIPADSDTRSRLAKLHADECLRAGL